MRILTGHYGAHRGGSERALLRLVDGWRALGHEVRCLECPDAGARYLGQRLSHQAASFAPDILFAGGQTYALPFLRARRSAALRGVPFVMKLSNTPHHPGQPWLSRAARRWLRLQARWTDQFVAPDQASQWLLEQIGIPARQIATIANPAADEAHLVQLHGRSPDRATADALHLISVGRLAPQKNVPLLIEAFARIARPADRLTIIGEGPLRAALEQQIARHAAAISLPGHVTDPTPYFAESNGFALASDFEGLPAVLVEALAAGLPIAATDSAPGIADLIGPHGQLVPVRDPTALAQAIDGLRHATPDRRAMLERARLFTAERSAPHYLSLFGALIQARHAGPTAADRAH